MICWFYKELAFKRYRKGKWLQNGLSGHSQIDTSSSPSSVCTWLVRDHLGILLKEQEDPHTPDVGTFAQSQRQNPLSDGLYPKTITHDKCMRGWCIGELIPNLLTPQRISETPKKHSPGGDHSEGHWHGSDPHWSRDPFRGTASCGCSSSEQASEEEQRKTWRTKVL